MSFFAYNSTLKACQSIQANRKVKWTGEDYTDFKTLPRGIWIWGNPRLGKTAFFRETFSPSLIYTKATATKWWDNYTQQPIVIMEDFDQKCLF